jgi:hypothetical protein
VAPAFFRKRVIETAYQLKNQVIGLRPSFDKLRSGYISTSSPPSSNEFRRFFPREKKNTRQGFIGGIPGRQFALFFFFSNGLDGGLLSYYGCGNAAFDILSGCFPHIFEVAGICDFCISCVSKSEAEKLESRLYPWPLIVLHGVKLSSGYSGLLIHNTSLSQIDAHLRSTYRDKSYSDGYFNPMRPYSGLPMTTGWAALMLGAWVRAARRGHFISALLILISAFIGIYAIIIWTSGIFGENVSTAFGIDASLHHDERREYRSAVGWAPRREV